METINIPEYYEKFDIKYDSKWNELPEEIIFMCETLSYFNHDDNPRKSDIIKMAKLCQEDYSSKIQELTEEQLYSLLEEVVS